MLVLPGNIQAVTEAPVLARADGYIRNATPISATAYQPGQVLAEIEAPELDQQIRQAQAAIEQAQADLEHARPRWSRARPTSRWPRSRPPRWDNLVKRGAVSKQDNDPYQSQYQAQQANVQALEKAVAAAASNLAAAAGQPRAVYSDLQAILKVRAPFAGVITVRNIDVGALVNAGNTLLFRIAQTNRLRTYVNVPQSSASDVRVGQTAASEHVRSCRTANSGHRHAHRQRARSRHPHPAGGGSGPQSGRQTAARHVRRGGPESARARIRRC